MKTSRLRCFLVADVLAAHAGRRWRLVYEHFRGGWNTISREANCTSKEAKRVNATIPRAGENNQRRCLQIRCLGFVRTPLKPVKTFSVQIASRPNPETANDPYIHHTFLKCITVGQNKIHIEYRSFFTYFVFFSWFPADCNLEGCRSRDHCGLHRSASLCRFSCGDHRRGLPAGGR